MSLNLDNASEKFELDVIPEDTIVILAAKLKPGNAGENGMLTRSSSGTSEYAAFEFTVVGGPYDKRKIFENMLLVGTSDGQARAAEISRAKLRAIFESAHGIAADDNSEATRARRASAELADFNGLQFVAVLGIEVGGRRPDGGNYRDKNFLKKVLRIGDVGWRKLDQKPAAPMAGDGAPASTAAPVLTIAKPSWAS
jgi:hypothetical protein